MTTTPTTQNKSSWLSYLSLFTSVGTLLCCALPSLLVLVGLGASVASALSFVPWLVTLSRHKNWTFAIAGVLIAANLVYVSRVVPRLKAAACAVGDGKGLLDLILQFPVLDDAI